MPAARHNTTDGRTTLAAADGASRGAAGNAAKERRASERRSLRRRLRALRRDPPAKAQTTRPAVACGCSRATRAATPTRTAPSTPVTPPVRRRVADSFLFWNRRLHQLLRVPAHPFRRPPRAPYGHPPPRCGAALALSAVTRAPARVAARTAPGALAAEVGVQNRDCA